MKYILFILLIPVFCFGQKVKPVTHRKPMYSINSFDTGTHWIVDSMAFREFKIIYPYYADTIYTKGLEGDFDTTIQVHDSGTLWNNDSMYHGDPLVPNVPCIDCDSFPITPNGAIELDTMMFISNGNPQIKRFAFAPILDTIKVILLISDTLRWHYDANYEHEIRIGQVFYTFGYLVREKHNVPGCGNCLSYWRHFSYLDRNKNPLPKNIIVWGSK